ncbi:MAG: beta-lactamase family protein [Chthonomonas sp.]|nr:beta-lactamase family protein [Chthonomonas sp.]
MSYLASLLLLTVSAPQPDVIDQYVEAQMKAQHIPGLTILVVLDGKILKRQGYGFSHLETKAAAKVEDRFDMGSIGKTFTATMIMQLVEKGKLKLEDKVSQHLSDWPKAWGEITIKQLISHQSGVPEYAGVPTIGLNDTYDAATWKKLMYALPLDFKPGQMFQYSNSNFTTLGMILEKVYNKKYIDIVNQQVFKPAGMKSTVFRTKQGELPKGSAAGYFYGTEWENAGPGGIAATPADGGGFTTVDDLRKFIEAGRAGKLVKLETLRQMQQASLVTSGRTTPYGLGWMVSDTSVSHGGNSVGFAAAMSTFPAQKLEIYMLCNTYSVLGDGFAAGLAMQLAPELKPKPVPNATDPDPARTARLLEAFRALASGNIDDKAFGPDMQARLKTLRGQMALQTMAPYTKCQALQFTAERDAAPDHIVQYRFVVDGVSRLVEFVITPEGPLYSVRVLPDPGRGTE